MPTHGLSLDGDWRLAVDPGNVGRAQKWWREPVAEAQPARVPGIIQEVFSGYHGVAWYWTEFQAPPNPNPGGRCLLRFGAVDYLAQVWLNGVHLGGHEGGETPFELDGTDAIRPGTDNLLAVRVLNPTNEPIDGIVLAETPHRNKAVPHYVGGSYNYGGITEPVELLLTPALRLADLFARPDPASGRVRVMVRAHNSGGQAVEARLWCGVTLDHSDAVLAEAETGCRLPPGDTEVGLELTVPRHRLWELDDPVLYRAAVRLSSGASEAGDERSARLGFRDFRVGDGFFRLNGRRLFLKSTHTGNHCPLGQILPPRQAPDLLRLDLLYAKASGFNMVRFIAGIAHPWQLDLCDEIGLMVYEESLAGWCLQDSPQMAERFDRSLREMVLRDRNHPSVTIWGLLNETMDGPVFRRAVESLPLLRALDDTRLVLLGSGRWDNQFSIGSVSNPGSSEWEHVWGAESPDYSAPFAWGSGGYVVGAGDAHVYPSVPHTPETERLLRTLGEGVRPVFLSEYGIGSVMNVIREARTSEQRGVRPDAEDAALLRAMAENFLADWQRFGLDGVYPFPEDMLLHSQRLHGRQRTLGFNLIRANPQIAGYNLTGMLDHGMTGEGLWTFWREWKPGIADALRDGWAPLRWCLFAHPMHGYAGRPLQLEAVLANEEVLPPGAYPVTLRVCGPQGVAWEQRTEAVVAPAAPGAAVPFATPVFTGEVTLDGPAGVYQFAADLERGGSPAGARLTFYLSSPVELPQGLPPVELWGVEPRVQRWLEARGVDGRPYRPGPLGTRQVVLVGDLAGMQTTPEDWGRLLEGVERGGVALFLSPQAFRRDDDPLGWLPLKERGRCYEFSDWLYHKECVANRHPVFAGLAEPGLMDWDYYGPVISHTLFEGQETPDEVMVAAFALGYSCPGGYTAGVMLGAYRLGAGMLVLNTLRVLENLDLHPAADRLLLNLLAYAAARVGG